MRIQYEDQREDVANRYLTIVLARLTISPTIANRIRQAKEVDQVSTCSSLVREANGLYQMREQLIVPDFEYYS